ncbi:MAG: HlyC/CorC family transporter [Saprospiraceae bacterium]|nr:HlyC/CorC family transporter [Saprospiraceae bacterium]
MIIIGIIIFTLLSAVFSGMEIAFVTANRVSVEIERNKRSLKGRILNSFYNNPKEFIGVLLVGNNITIIVLTYLGSQLLDPFLKQFIVGYYLILLVKTLIIAVFALIFAEFIPKAIFKAYANEAIMRLSVPVYLLRIILKAPTLLFTSLSSFILKYIFRTRIIDANVPLSRLDLEHFIEDNITEEHDIEKDMFQKALNLDQVKARDVMVPRTEIIAIDKSATKNDLIDLIETTKHSRIILIDDDIENVVGYIHHQQLINEKFTLAGDNFMPVSFVPETMNAKELLLKFIREKQNIAIVVDEYGGIAGMITLEDLTEEIFGEIEDEYDIEDSDSFEKYLGNDEYVLAGRMEIDYLNEKYELLGLPLGEYNTVSGLIVNHLGEIPDRGKVFEIGNFNFRILKVSKNKIDLVKVRKNV